MRPSFRRSCLSVLLKFLNFIQAFVGVSIAIYSLWVLNRWIRHGGGLDVDDLPRLWFACVLMAAGAVVCLIVFVGYVAAEAGSSCCLCFYALLTAMLILLEAALASVLMSDKHWDQDLPYDATGELKNLLTFIEDNMDISKCVAISMIVVQVLSLFLAMILRSMVSKRKVDYDSDEDFVVIRRPLLYPSSAPPYVANPVDGRAFHSDIWSSRMRQKYGFNQNEFAYESGDPKASMY